MSFHRLDLRENIGKLIAPTRFQLDRLVDEVSIPYAKIAEMSRLW